MSDTLKITNRIIELTEQEKLDWFYLSDDIALCQELGLREAPKNDIARLQMQFDKTVTFYDGLNSFYTTVNDNYIILLASAEEDKMMRDKLTLLLVTEDYKDRKNITNYEAILQLHTLVKNSFPSVDDIIKDLFEL